MDSLDVPRLSRARKTIRFLVDILLVTVLGCVGAALVYSLICTFGADCRKEILPDTSITMVFQVFAYIIFKRVQKSNDEWRKSRWQMDDLTRFRRLMDEVYTPLKGTVINIREECRTLSNLESLTGSSYSPMDQSPEDIV